MRVRTALLRWYDTHRRALPWRTVPSDPYRTWVSEIMLQQTRVATAVPYFRRFVASFPDVAALAAAPLSRVLALWAGLGYYRRAHQLHAAAQRIMAGYAGALPSEVAELRTLPGVGRYTAGAIASIAFGRAVAAVDGNAARVIARWFGLPRVGERVWSIAAALVPKRRAGDFNQALMELGARVCRPAAPACGTCPIRAVCRSRDTGDAPGTVRRRGGPRQKRRFEIAAVVLENGGRVLLRQRARAGLWPGLWDFPQAELRSGERASDAAARAAATVGVAPDALRSAGTVERDLTHRRLVIHVFHADWPKAARGSRRPRGPTRVDRQVDSNAGAARWADPDDPSLAKSAAARAVWRAVHADCAEPVR